MKQRTQHNTIVIGVNLLDYEEETRLQVSQTPHNLSYPWFLQPKNNPELPLRTRVPKGINSEVTCPQLVP